MLQLARNEDRPAVEMMAQQVHGLHVVWRPDLYEKVSELYTTERFREAVRERNLYVAKNQDEVLGYVRVKICVNNCPGLVNRKLMILDEIAVREDCRDMGIGSEMMNDLKVLAKAFGCTDLQLGVYPQNDDAVAFFQKNGLTIRSIEMQMKL